MLQRDPKKRFQTASQIKRHPWFKGVRWEKLAVKKVVPPFRFRPVCTRSLIPSSFFGELMHSSLSFSYIKWIHPTVMARFPFPLIFVLLLTAMELMPSKTLIVRSLVFDHK